MKLSIVVPVYKVESYIRECVDSILNQTFTDWELLLINDGSPDSSGLICEEYAQKDSRIKVFHKNNGGVGTARNLGIEQAGGEWITFVDADDFVGPYYLEKINKSTCDLDIELIHAGCKNYKDGDVSINQEYEDVVNDNDSLLFKSFRGLVVSKWFKKSIIRKYNIRFDERMKIGEDYVFTVDYITHISKYALNSCTDYYYRIHSNSASHQRRSFKDYDVALYEFQRQYMAVVKYITFKRIPEKDCWYRWSILSTDILNVILMLFHGSVDNAEIEKHIKTDFSPEQISLIDMEQGFKRRIVALLLKLKLYSTIKCLSKFRA